MSPAEHFLRHAAECELMSKSAPGTENKEAWKRMAARWLRCAELYESQSSVALQARSVKRQRAQETLRP